MSDPTIRIPSCRGDGRCPVCDRTVGHLTFLEPLACGCRACPACKEPHLRALLTEALRQRDKRTGDALALLIRIPSCRGDGRCPECGYVGDGGYRFTSVAICGCIVCVICEPVHFRALLTEALRQRDAIQQGISSEVAMLREDVARLSAAAALRAEERDVAIRERDSARGVVDDLRESLDRQEDEIAALTKERGHVEALLRECQDAVREAASAAEDCGDRARAREWDTLIAKIREVTGR